MYRVIITIVTLQLILTVNGHLTCKYNVAVNITDGLKESYGVIIKDNVEYSPKNYYETDDGRIYGCPCNIKTCLRKCCEMGRAPLNKSCTIYEEDLLIELHKEKKFIKEVTVNIHNFYLLDLTFCPNQKYLLRPDDDYFDTFLIQRDGSLYLPYANEDNYVLPIDYCIDTFVNNKGRTHVNVKLCGALSQDASTKAFYSMGKTLIFHINKLVKKHCLELCDN